MDPGQARPRARLSIRRFLGPRFAPGPAPTRVHFLTDDLRPSRFHTGMTVIEWLLDADPSIRWQVMRDLLEERAEVVAAERARVVSEGWGARLLARQGPGGQWGGGTTHFPLGTAT